jgi:glycosyltransferase involved in cell wall biosynthesis
MKIIHLSTGRIGGAGKAALSLHQALLKNGIKSIFFSLITDLDDLSDKENQFYIAKKRAMQSKFFTFLNLKFSKLSFFSLFNSNQLDESFFMKYNSPHTIFHFHNCYNLINSKMLLSLKKMKINCVFTLHDEFLYTGGCHYAFDCEGFREGCSTCPRISFVLNKIPALNLSIKCAALKNNQWNFIAPSNWIAKRARESLALSGESIHHITNVITENESSVIERIPYQSDVIKIGLAAMDWRSYIKGGSLVLKIIREIQERNLPIIFDYLNSRKYLGSKISFWKNIDILLVPSLVDNSPNVIVEAKSFGVQVIATPVGGIPELLEPSFDSLVYFNGHLTEDFLLAIEQTKLKYTKSKAYNEIKKIKDRNRQATDDHIQLYSSILNYLQ